jgi:tRNA dimethylallyltransferase
MDCQIEEIAIIGATASGKSSLAIDIAKREGAIILSLDSLSIYREIDIVSAKPTVEEMGGIEHLGIDVIYPDEPFDVTIFMSLYRDAHKIASDSGKKLIIVGGSSFYLKSLIDGISPLPHIDREIKERVSYALSDLPKSYDTLYRLDPTYMSRISSSDRYRIERALSILWAVGEIPSEYFKKHPPIPTIKKAIPIYHIETDRAILRERIAKRTDMMLQSGLIDEVAYLEKRYTRSPNPMKAIGIKECLEFLDGMYSRRELREKIITNTARLAKRQTTFNRSQFGDLISLDIKSLKSKIMYDTLH